MPAPLEKPNITNRTRLLARALLESIFLDITHGLHGERNHKNDDRDDVGRFAKAGLRVLQHVRGIYKSYRKTDSPAPKHLKDPESEKREEFVTLVVEAVVGASLQDAEEEETRKTGAPEHDHYTDDNITGMGDTGKSKCQDC